MRPSAPALLAAAALALAAAPASAQLRILLADRDSDTIWILTDRNNNGVIEEPGEIAAFYNISNASGQPAPLNPNSIGVTRDRRVFVGDQDTAARHWLLLRDRNRDGDALDEGEAIIAAGPGNASGALFTFPVGFAEDAAGNIYLGNAGNAFGPDQVWRGRDLTGEGDLMGENEVAPFISVNGFGTNGAFSPQEIVIGADGALYLRNSGNAGNAIFRLADSGVNGIDQTSEFTLFFGPGNAQGTPASTGFALEIDPLRERAFYTLQTATGGIDQLVRAVDVGNNGDAQSLLESDIVFSTAEAGFTAIDLLALPDGRVLVSDNSGNRIIALVDAEGNDGRFTLPSERSNFFANSTGIVTAARGMVLFPCPGDFNADLATNPDDLADFITCFFLDVATPGSCPASDFNADGFRDPDDLADFVTSFFTAC